MELHSETPSTFRRFISSNGAEMAVAMALGVSSAAFVKVATATVFEGIFAALLNTKWTGWVVNINGFPIRYGAFLNGVIEWAIVLAVFLYIMSRVYHLRSLGQLQCEYCLTPMPERASVCGACGRDRIQTEAPPPLNRRQS